jgi:hypothetical protein
MPILFKLIVSALCALAGAGAAIAQTAFYRAPSSEVAGARRRSRCGAPSQSPMSRKHGPSLQSPFQADQRVLRASSLGRRGLPDGRIWIA